MSAGRAIGPCRLARCLVAALSTALAVSGQSAAEFDRRLEVLDRAEPAARREAAGALLDAFLQLPDGPERSARVVAAARAAGLCGEPRVVLRLAQEARTRGPVAAELTAVQLRALAAVGSLAEFVDLATADRAAGRGAVVDEVLAEVEGRLLGEADRQMRRGRVAEGLAVFALLAAATPDDPVRLANHALALRHSGDVVEAERAYRRALALAPDDAGIWNDYGLFLRATGRLDDGVAALQRSLACEPVPGDGPATTNLLHTALVRPGSVRPDPLPAARAALQRRPDAALLRRTAIDALLRPGVTAGPAAASGGEAAPGAPGEQAPDNRARGR